MIQSAEMIVAALAAGAAAGATDTASSAVKESYQGLKSLVGKLLRKRDDDEQLADPGAHRVELVAALVAAGLEERPDLLRPAHQLRDLVRKDSACQVSVHDSTGISIGGEQVTFHINLSRE